MIGRWAVSRLLGSVVWNGSWLSYVRTIGDNFCYSVVYCGRFWKLYQFENLQRGVRKRCYSNPMVVVSSRRSLVERKRWEGGRIAEDQHCANSGQYPNSLRSPFSYEAGRTYCQFVSEVQESTSAYCQPVHNTKFLLNENYIFFCLSFLVNPNYLFLLKFK